VSACHWYPIASLSSFRLLPKRLNATLYTADCSICHNAIGRTATFTPHVSWVKASDRDLYNYQRHSYSIEMFCIAWRKGLRSVLDLPRATHNHLLPCFQIVCQSTMRYVNDLQGLLLQPVSAVIIVWLSRW